jgi:MYXO-CTERM domain-containing protein
MRTRYLQLFPLFVLLSGCGAGALGDDLAGTIASPIVGGKTATTCQWPSTVALTSDGICSGTLVHPQIVITAAHCGTNFKEAKFGENARTPARTVPIEYCKSYWDEIGVDETTAEFGDGLDRAFCKLKMPVTDVPIAPPLMGCETEILKPGLDVVIAGFGITAADKDDADTKRYVHTVLGETSRDSIRVGKPTANSCEGDSGGPAFVQLADGSWRTFGITNGSPDDTGACGSFTFYALVHKAVPWIEKTSGIDITPCHDADGTWNPTAQCRGFSTTPAASGRTWQNGCAETSISGLEWTCGAPFDGSGVDAGSVDGAAGNDGGAEASVGADDGMVEQQDAARADNDSDAGNADAGAQIAPPLTGSGGSGGSGGGSGATGGSGPVAPAGAAEEHGSCSVGHGAGGAAAWLWALVGALAGRRRRSVGGRSA